MAYSPDGTMLMIATIDGEAQRRDGESGRILGPILKLGERGWDVAFRPDGRHLVTGGDDRTARAWDVATGRTVGVSIEHTQPLLSVTVSPDGRLILTVTFGVQARLWDAASHKQIGPPMRSSSVSLGGRPAFASDSRSLAVVNDVAEVWTIPPDDAESFEQLRHRLKGFTGVEMDERGGFLPVEVGDPSAAP